MAEEEQQPIEDEPKKPEETTEEEGDNTPPSPSPLEESKKLVAEMKAQNKVLSDNLKKAEKLAAENILNGRVPVGQGRSQDDIDREAAQKLIKGSGFEDRVV